MTSLIKPGLKYDGTPSVGDIVEMAGSKLVGQGVYNNATPIPVTIGGILAGDTFLDVPIKTLLTNLLYPYIAPSITLSSNPAQGLREKGDDIVVGVDLTATTTKNTNNITSVVFQRPVGVLLYNVPVPIPAGGAELYTDPVGILSVNTTYRAVVGDGVVTANSNTLSFRFVYPFFYGVGAAGLTGAMIYAAFNHADPNVTGAKIIQNQADTTRTMSPTAQYYYFCYPATLPDLTVIYDGNGFDVSADFGAGPYVPGTIAPLRTVNILGLDGSIQIYKVYEYANLTSLSQALTFNF